MIDVCVVEFDCLIFMQFFVVMYVLEFQCFESMWCGLDYLVKESNMGQMIKIKVLYVLKCDFVCDFKGVSEFDQSVLFKKVYEEEFGMFGGLLFGVLIGDYEILCQLEDMYFIEQMLYVVVVVYVLFIVLVLLELFGFELFFDFGKLCDFGKVFDIVEYVKWKLFCDVEDFCYVGLMLLCFFGCLLFNLKDGQIVENFNFVEDVDGIDYDKYLWCNVVWVFVVCLMVVFDDFGWCVVICGVEGGGFVEDLLIYMFKIDDGEVVLKCLIEIVIIDCCEKELSDFGFILFVYCKNLDYVVFFVVQLVQKLKKYSIDSVNVNVVLFVQFQYIFLVLCVVYYLKVMMWDKIGSFVLVQNVEIFFNWWILQYVLFDDNVLQEQKV